MRIKEKALALRPYLEAITEHCQGLTKEKLLEVITGIAQDVPQNERADFLKKFPHLSKQKVESKTNSRNLLTQILDFKVDLLARMKSIDDGSYYDEIDYNDEYGLSDEGPPLFTDEMKIEVETYFCEADKVFLSGEFVEAKELYHALLYLVEDNTEERNQDKERDFFGHDNIDSYVDIDCCEIRARYCRCIFETQSDPKKLITDLIQAVDLTAHVDSYRLDLPEEKFPMLQDIVDAKPGKLPIDNDFLKNWKEAVKKQDADRAHLLLMEVVFMTEGMSSLEKLAKNWGAKQPRGYVYWIQKLVEKSDWKTAAHVCLETLEKLSQDSFKVQTAKYLIQAADQLDDKKLRLTGRREKFLASLNRKDLVACLSEADQQGKRDAEIFCILESILKVKDQKPLQTLLLILAGKLDQVFEQIKGAKAIGWSGEEGGTGLLFASLLMTLTKTQETQIIKVILQQYADSHSSYTDWFDENEGTKKVESGVTDEILKTLKNISATPEQEERWMAWALRIAKNRIDHILTNKHRRAYGRAAEILGALAEYHLIKNNRVKAATLIQENRDKKYNRFPAFKQELKSVMGSSKLLRELH